MRAIAAPSMAFVALAVMGCAPSDPVAEPSEVAPSTAQTVAEQPAATAVDVAPEGVPEPSELVGAWLLEDLGGRDVVDMVQTTIEFDAEGRVLGSGGCNRFTGSYSFEGGRLEFSPLAGTKMMCPEAVMDQEDRFHRALGAVERVEMDGPFLLIFEENSDQPLRFTKTEQEVEL